MFFSIKKFSSTYQKRVKEENQFPILLPEERKLKKKKIIGTNGKIKTFYLQELQK